MKILIISMLIITCLTLVSGQTADTAKFPAVGGPMKFDPARDAEKDIQNAIGLARKSGRNIFLDVGGEWCIWCHRLDSLFAQNKDLDEFLNRHFVVVKINVSEENKNEKVLSKYPKVAGYPHIFILNKNGKLLCSQDTGELEYPKGYPVKGHDKVKVFAFLKKWTK